MTQNTNRKPNAMERLMIPVITVLIKVQKKFVTVDVYIAC